MEEGLKLKKGLIEHCHAHVEERLTTITSSLRSIEESRNGETKSSAGDKFETGRAMMQMEEAKLNAQLGEVMKLQETMAGVKETASGDRIATGSLVATNRGLYFLAVGIGKVKLGGRTIFCTSLGAPIGQQLHGKQVGERFSFNELEFEVLGLV